MRIVQGDIPHFVLVRRGDELSGFLGGFAALILPRCAKMCIITTALEFRV
jgi:hypothetical protein